MIQPEATSSAERVRRHRRRKAQGKVVVTMEIDLAERAMLALYNNNLLDCLDEDLPQETRIAIRTLIRRAQGRLY